MKKKIHIFLFILFYLTCRTAGEKTLEGEGAVDDLTLRGYIKFTIFQGRNLLGYAQDPKNPKEFPKKVWKPREKAYKSSKVEQRLLLEFNQDKMAEAKVNLLKIVEFDAGSNKFQKIRLILENPVEYIWEDVQPIEGVDSKLLQQKYIRSLLQVSRIILEFETKDGKRLKTGTDFSQYGVQLGINAKTSESESVVFFAKDAYVGYKLADPPKVSSQTQVVERFQRVLIAPFFVNSKEDKENLERLLYNATRDALNRVPNIKALERDPGVLYTESQLTDRNNINKLKDVASLQDADLIFVGEFHRYGNDVVAKVQGFLRDNEGELVSGKSVKLTVEDISKVQFFDLGDNWEKELLTTFDKWIPQKEVRSTQNELAYKEYLKGLEEIAKIDEESVNKAIHHFEKTVELDNKFAEAYAMLSEAYTESVKLKYGVVSNLSEEEKRKKADLQEKALQAGNKALELKPKLSLAYRALGKHYFHIGYTKRALDSAEKSFKLDSKDARTAWLLFFIKAEDDKRILYDKNNSDFKVAYELNPNLFESLRNMGLISEKRQNYDKATEYYKKALARSPKHLETHFDLARVYRKKKKFEESLKLLQSTEEFYPKNYRVWQNFALHYRDKKEYPKAASYYEKILDEDTEHFVNVASDVVDFYTNYYGKPKLGMELIEEAIIKDKNNVDSYYNMLGNFYLLKGEHKKAREYYQKTLEIRLNQFGQNDKSIADIYVAIGNAYKSKGDYDKALEYQKKSLDIYLKKLGPDHPDVAGSYNNIGVAYFHKNENDEAIEYYQKSLGIDLKKLGPDHPYVSDSYANIGNAYVSKGDYNKALEYQKKSLGIDLKKLGPDHPYVAGSYNNIGWVYYSKGEYDKAIEYYQKSLGIYLKKLGPDHPEVINLNHNIGFAYTSKGEYDKAIEYFQKADSYAFLSQVYLLKNDKKKANEYIEKAFNINHSLSNKSLLWFYRYAHFPKWRSKALTELQKLMRNKEAKSIGLDLSKNVELAIKEGHPNPKKLKEIAKWITED